MAASVLLLLCLIWLFVVMNNVDPACGANFYQHFEILWGNDKAKVLNNGELVTLSLDRSSGSGFRSKNEYLYGKLDMQIKLVPGNSAGTVTSYYLSSKGGEWDEIDFEFLGNKSGDPYTIHTNVITQGKGDREQQFHLWFDPTLDFHNYSILWNPLNIIWFVDGSPIRELKNLNSNGIPYPKKEPMRLYSSLWDGEDWATRGGLVKTDWTKAPFTASFRGFNNAINACVWSSNIGTKCDINSTNSRIFINHKWLKEELDGEMEDKLKWVHKNFMIYNYCTDTKRFPQGLPPECVVNT